MHIDGREASVSSVSSSTSAKNTTGARNVSLKKGSWDPLRLSVINPTLHVDAILSSTLTRRSRILFSRLEVPTPDLCEAMASTRIAELASIISETVLQIDEYFTRSCPADTYL